MVNGDAESDKALKQQSSSVSELPFGPTPSKTVEMAVDDDSSSLCCSLPLDKVQGVLKPFHKTENVKRKVLCLYCDRSFGSVNLRQKHVERVHSVNKQRRVSSRRQNNLTTTPCGYCNKLDGAEKTLKDLFQHLVQEHSERYFGCLPCEDRFLTPSLLAEHNTSKHKNYETAVVEVVNIEEVAEEVPFKITRSRLKQKVEEEEQTVLKKKTSKLKEIKNKKMSVKTSKIALRRRESKRSQTKLPTTQKKNKRNKPNEKTTVTEVANKTVEKIKTCINPYPEFDSFYRVKKITDHSIDNLKISSLTFDDVFDKAFFNRIKCNIEENLLHHIDGKLFKNEESENRISNFEKITPISNENQSSTLENFGCDISLNAVTPVASLSLNSQFGEDFESQIEYGSKPGKKKQTQRNEVHYKYFTRRKFQASILEHKENRDLSRLDMWTQLVIKKRQQKMLDQKKTAKEMLEYTTGDEYRSKLRREELNRILDRRGPFEDLKEEASKKAALDKLNSPENDMSYESYIEVREVLNEILNRVFETATNVPENCNVRNDDQREIPAYLNLRRSSSFPNEEIDKSDRITLICSSQETENFELPTNQIRDKNEIIELSGEWARCRMYICAACGAKLPNMKYLLEHKNIYHQNVWVQHYEFVGNQSELYRHLSIPGLGKVGAVEEGVPCKIWKRSDSRLCTKCAKQCNSLGELHRHILECGGDWTWMLARKKCKYRPFGSKSRRKRRGLVHRVHVKQKTEPTEKKKYKKSFEGPRQKPSDADTIQRMLANLPAKRSTRKLISLQEGIYRARKKKIETQTNKTKIKCGKVIYKSRNMKENTEKTINSAGNNSMRTLRSISKVLSSKIIDSNATLAVRRKLRVMNERRKTKQFQDENEAENEDTKKGKKGQVPVKKILSGKINIKSFFPVKKQNIVNGEKKEESNGDVKDKETRSKKKLKLEGAAEKKNENKTESLDSEKKGKNAVLNKIKSITTKKKVKPEVVQKDDETENNRKRKLRQSFRNVVEKVKKMKFSKESVPAPFLEKPVPDDKLDPISQPEKIVIPSPVPEAKLNVADISETVPIVMKFNETDDSCKTPEMIFKLESNNEKSLQAKGELNFDKDKPKTAMKKVRKPSRGLNDCIAMLTSKLQEKTKQVEGVLDLSKAANPKPILKIPTFKSSHVESETETALDLSMKTKPDIFSLDYFLEKKPVNIFYKEKLLKEPKVRQKYKKSDVPVQKIVANNTLQIPAFKVYSTWNSVDETIQNVIDNHQQEKNAFKESQIVKIMEKVTKTTVDDIIEFVVSSNITEEEPPLPVVFESKLLNIIPKKVKSPEKKPEQIILDEQISSKTETTENIVEEKKVEVLKKRKIKKVEEICTVEIVTEAEDVVKNSEVTTNNMDLINENENDQLEMKFTKITSDSEDDVPLASLLKATEEAREVAVDQENAIQIVQQEETNVGEVDKNSDINLAEKSCFENESVMQCEENVAEKLVETTENVFKAPLEKISKKKGKSKKSARITRSQRSKSLEDKSDNCSFSLIHKSSSLNDISRLSSNFEIPNISENIPFEDIPKISEDAPKIPEEIPQDFENSNKMAEEVPIAFGDAPKISAETTQSPETIPSVSETIPKVSEISKENIAEPLSIVEEKTAETNEKMTPSQQPIENLELPMECEEIKETIENTQMEIVNNETTLNDILSKIRDVSVELSKDNIIDSLKQGEFLCVDKNNVLKTKIPEKFIDTPVISRDIPEQKPKRRLSSRSISKSDSESSIPEKKEEIRRSPRLKVGSEPTVFNEELGEKINKFLDEERRNSSCYLKVDTVLTNSEIESPNLVKNSSLNEHLIESSEQVNGHLKNTLYSINRVENLVEIEEKILKNVRKKNKKKKVGTGKKKKKQNVELNLNIETVEKQPEAEEKKEINVILPEVPTSLELVKEPLPIVDEPNKNELKENFAAIEDLLNTTDNEVPKKIKLKNDTFTETSPNLSNENVEQKKPRPSRNKRISYVESDNDEKEVVAVDSKINENSENIVNEELEPPIKIIINKQKTRRKSKSFKKGNNFKGSDLFKDFALVIKKPKRSVPIIYSDCDVFSKDSDIDDKSKSDSDLDVSVEEMDMEIDDIPFTANIIERNEETINEIDLKCNHKNKERKFNRKKLKKFDQILKENNQNVEESANKLEEEDEIKPKEVDIDSIYNFTESDDFETEKPIEIPRFPRKQPPVVNLPSKESSSQAQFEQILPIDSEDTKNCNKKKSKFTREVAPEEEILTFTERKIRTAKVKALENIHDEALAELTEPDLNKKAKKMSKNAVKDFEFSKKIEPPLFADLVADLAGLEELENSIERELNAETTKIEENDKKENEELRRSRRGSRKITSYNENDLIDPILDLMEEKKKVKKKEDKAVDNIIESNASDNFENDLTSTESFNRVFEKIIENSTLLSRNVTQEESKKQTKKNVKRSMSPIGESSESNTISDDKSKNFCEICNKSFIRIENLIKHKVTLTHIQKLSELEAREAEQKQKQTETQNIDINITNILLQSEKPGTPINVVHSSFSNNDSLKLADIISDVLNKPVLPNEDVECNEFTNTNKRCKSLGERKSFDSEHSATPFVSKTTILEKQISLLENIIENVNYIDDISMSSNNSNDNKNVKKIDTAQESFLKPTQYEEISEDSANLRNYEDQKLRKTLNRDEELFLECCSLLKSGSEVSTYNNSNNINQQSVEQTNQLEQQSYPEEDYSGDNSRIPTPLGDSFDDDASDSNTISSNWDINKMEPVFENKEVDNSNLTFQKVLGNVQCEEPNTNCDRVSSFEMEEVPEEEKLPDTCKIITKGARKVFEGLKVSIRTEELNMDEVLNRTSKLLPEKPDDDKLEEKAKKTGRKSKPVKNSQVGSNLLFKMNKKKFPNVSDEKSLDVYDFEETQDNTEIFTKPDFKTFRNKKSEGNESDGEENFDSIVPESNLESSTSSTLSTKKPKSQENITKKKCMIMGRIFKNQARSKLEGIDEEMRDIPVIDTDEMVDNYVATCKKIIKNEQTQTKPKLTETEINELFDQLLENKNTEKKPDNGANSTHTKTTVKSRKADNTKKKKLKAKKRSRNNSESTDDEFSLNKTTKRACRKNGKAEDNCINLEQELKECIGVASRKSQRKCTSGKQNVLVEYWSSDDSQFEALLESQKIELKPLPVVEKSIIEMPPITETNITKKPPRPKKKPEVKKKSEEQTDIAKMSFTNRRKRAAVNPLYHWSSSSEDESHDLIEVKPIRDEPEDDEDRPVQHGWIVGDSPKKLVTMLAQAKGKKADVDCVKEQKKRTNANS